MKKALTYTTITLSVIFILFLIIPHIFGGMSSSPKQTICKSDLKNIGLALKQYAADNNGLLPESFDDWLADEHLVELQCPFHTDKTTNSYIYHPPNKTVVDKLGRKIILYCNTEHPKEVFSSDGDKGKGVVPVILEDFSLDSIPIADFELKESQ